MTPGDVIVIVLLLLALIGVFFYSRQRKKSGKGCCGDCQGCSQRTACTSGKNPERK